MTAFTLTGEIGPADPGVRLYFGNPGSGKSYALSRSVMAAAAHRTIIVVDATREWADDDGVMGRRLPDGTYVVGARTLARAMDAAASAPRGIVIYHPRIWVDDTIALVDAMAASRARNLGIAISEAHNLMPNGQPLAPGFDAIVTRWRHLHMAAWFDTQRPARLARTVTELATEISLFACNGPRDAEAVADLVSDPKSLLAANDESCRRFAAGESGWHVRLGLDRAPPYTLRRAT